jgi:hypothetical protein
LIKNALKINLRFQKVFSKAGSLHHTVRLPAPPKKERINKKHFFYFAKQENLKSWEITK